MKELFGTDGIRGRAGEFPLDEKTVRIIGASLARQLRAKKGGVPAFVTGRDTRESGEWIEKAFHAGAAAEGAECLSAAVITTPGVAFLTGSVGRDAGIVISASHNPYRDNGIKIFSPTGKKIDEATERAIERDIRDGGAPKTAANVPADYSRADEFKTAYIEHLVEKIKHFETPFKIVVDCANGAASELAPTVFQRLKADVLTINASPDGRNINEGCGSLHLEKLRTKVLEEKADFGVAFDGDADRALFVDERGEIVDGDATLWIMARYLKGHGKLANSIVVSTVMSNLGLELALKSIGVTLLRTSVGDKYVLEKLLETGSEIGGEQSGHIIFPENSLVGDGIMTALLVLNAVREEGVPVSAMMDGFIRYPQVLVNVTVREKRPFMDVAEIATIATEIEAVLHGEGRLLLRYSGTENLARVMIEGKDQAEIERQAQRLADVIRRSLG
jgi:phosphoglucosamine mutase